MSRVIASAGSMAMSCRHSSREMPVNSQDAVEHRIRDQFVHGHAHKDIAVAAPLARDRVARFARPRIAVDARMVQSAFREIALETEYISCQY